MIHRYLKNNSYYCSYDEILAMHEEQGSIVASIGSSVGAIVLQHIARDGVHRYIEKNR